MKKVTQPSINTSEKSVIRVGTWNVHLGLELKQILKTIQENEEFKELDILVLQESSVDNEIDNAQDIAKALGKNYTYYQEEVAHVFNRVQANAIIWNTKTVSISQKARIILPKYTEVTLPFFERTFITKFVYLQNRNYLVIEGKINKVSFRFYNIQLDTLGYLHKKIQLQRLFNDEKAKPSVDLVLVAGDLNTLLWRNKSMVTKLAQEAGFELISEKKGTLTVGFRILKLGVDMIFVKSSKMIYHKSRILNVKGSDHLPVLAEIELESRN